MSKQTKCPKCKKSGADCIDTRTYHKKTSIGAMVLRRRRYKCYSCQNRWTSFEIPKEYLHHLENKVKAIGDVNEMFKKIAGLA